MNDLMGNPIDERKLLAQKYTGAIKLVMDFIIEYPKLYEAPPEKVKAIIIAQIQKKDAKQSVFTIDRSIRKVWSMDAFKPPEAIQNWRRKQEENHRMFFKQ